MKSHEPHQFSYPKVSPVVLATSAHAAGTLHPSPRPAAR